MIRHFTQNDISASEDLRRYVFHSAYTPEKRTDYHCLLDMGDGIGAFDDGNLVGQLINLPLQISFYGDQIKATGVNHVGVYPEARGRGIASSLIRESLLSGKKSGSVLSILQPFSPAFYRKFGYDIFTKRIRYHLTSEKFPHFDTNNQILIHRFAPSNKDKMDRSQIRALYLEVALQTHGMHVRDEKWWRRQETQHPDLNYAVAVHSGDYVGYVSYSLDGTRMEIIDFIYESNEVRRQLWNFLSAHAANVFEIGYTSTAAHQMSYDFSDPRIEQSVWLDTMVRIIDIKALLEMWVDKNGCVQELRFRVIDDVAPWNSGVYTMSKSGVQLTQAGSGEQVTAQELAAIFLGPLSSSSLALYLGASDRPIINALIKMASKKLLADFISEF
ncbi:GNAT family N-acetyltransferase [Lacticaseibacillus hegangensis]|uniref:Enhanced intracellular survival protein Eis n=1 Tax=Lacticaseibacillus hegangensis TaxID=2486010 RepID=A0ABW4CYG1_9LACO|nr:GNAT family N-acetyltransferase [Lacticaseibacillus hegangensis]